MVPELLVTGEERKAARLEMSMVPVVDLVTLPS